MLLASVPPASMYISPTAFAGGVRCSIQAIAQPIAFSSMHIGSGPGVAGLSAMQVKPPRPRRTMRIVPSGRIATIVAARETDAGAAAIALAISAESPDRAGRWRAWLAAAPAASIAAAAVNDIKMAVR